MLLRSIDLIAPLTPVPQLSMSHRQRLAICDAKVADPHPIFHFAFRLLPPGIMAANARPVSLLLTAYAYRFARLWLASGKLRNVIPRHENH